MRALIWLVNKPATCTVESALTWEVVSAATWLVNKDSICTLLKLFTAPVLMSARLVLVIASNCKVLSPGVWAVVMLLAPLVFKAFKLAVDRFEIWAEVSVAN